MLLYESDWVEKYPYAIVDTKTDNESFLRYSALLREMGVSNHLWPLALFNPDLQGVDPHSPHLDLETMAAIAVEAKSNFWYYCRSLIRVPGGTPEEPIMLRANRGNMALYWLFFNHITTILIQIRQTGKSLSTDILMTYLLNIRCTKTQINLLTKDDTLRAANLERLKNIELELPYYLKQRNRGDIGNTEELSVKSLGNSYRGHLPNKSPKMALKVGRGLTSPVFQIDEAAFFDNIAISMPSALAAGTAARDLARRRDEPYGTILTTTAGKKDDRDGAYIFDLVQKGAVWSERLFDSKDPIDLERLVRNSSSNRELLVSCTLNHKQLGYTDEWLRRAIEESKATGEDADRDFGNVWTSGSQMSPLPIAVTEAIRASQINDHITEISSPYSYITRWYTGKETVSQRMGKGHFILSVDSSDAVGGDDIGVTLRDIKTGEVVASGNYNETNLITFAEWLCNWLVKYTNVTLIIERRSTGAMILDYLLLMLPTKGIDPFARIYNKVVQEAEEYPERFKEVNRPMAHRSTELYIKYKKLFGFATSASGATSRGELYGTTLMNAAKTTGTRVKDPKTINQILGLVIRNGRIDHATGSKDDLCISWLLSYWLISLGKNLHCYGINARDILADNAIVQQASSPLAVYNSQEQEYLRREIEKLVTELKNEKDIWVSQKLEIKLQLLSMDLTDADRQTLSLDELISNIKEFKRLNTNTGYKRNYY